MQRPSATGVHALNVDDTGRTQVTNNLTSNTHKSLPDIPLDADEDGELINTVESLRRGLLVSCQRYPTPYTILLVGETGVGKSSVLEFIANVLKGNSTDQYDFNILDRNNEQGGSDKESQTKEAKLYKLRSENGMWVQILDTPGLADTRGLHQDDSHKESIANAIKDNIDSINAVLILANGTVPRITVGTDYALSTLSAIFPKTLTNNIAFMFTNVASPLCWNFSQDTVPPVLRGAAQFLLDNPISLQSKYMKMKNDPNMRKVRTELDGAVRDGEEKALRVLADFFDWVDCLEPQPTIEILSLYEKSRAIELKLTATLSQMDQAETKKLDIDKLMTALAKDSANMDAFAKFEKTVNMPVWKRVDTTSHNTLCNQINCYSNCHIGCTSDFSLDPEKLKTCTAMTNGICNKCNHGVEFHQHYRSKWEEVIDTQVTVDQDLKTKWEVAKNAKDEHSGFLSAEERALRGLNQDIRRATKKLARMADNYAGLSLSGSFSVQVEKSVSLLEQKYKGMEEGGVEQEQLHRVKEVLDQMTKKLGLLRSANEKVRRVMLRDSTMAVRGGFKGQGQSHGQDWQNQVVSLNEKPQAIELKIVDLLSQMYQAETKKWDIDKLMTALTKESANMDAFANFERAVTSPVWKRVDTTAQNTLCCQTNCYSNCHIGCIFYFSLDPETLKSCTAMTDGICDECNHGWEYHHHYRAKWEEVIETQTAVDQDLRTKWEAEKAERDKTSVLISAGESALKALNQVIERTTKELARLADDYAGLPLSGSFFALIENTVRFKLQQKSKGVEERGVEQEQSQKVKESLILIMTKSDLWRRKDRRMRMAAVGPMGLGQGWHRQGQIRGQGWQSPGQRRNQRQGKDRKGWMRKAKSVVLGSFH